MEFVWDTHASDFIRELNRQRASGTLCDTSVHVGDYVIPVHRCVLAASSDYFKTLFSSELGDRHASKYCLPSVKNKTADSVVEFMYTGRINLTLTDVEDTLIAADFLCMPQLKGYCSKLLKANLDDGCCLHIKLMSYRYSLIDIQETIDSYLSPRFGALLRRPEALEMPHDLLTSLLSDPQFNYVREQDLVEFLVKWMEWDSKGRAIHVQQLAETIQINYLPACYIQTQILANTSRVPVLMRNLIGRQVEEDGLMEEPALSQRDEVRGRLQMEDILFCRSRAVKIGEEVQLLLYVIRDDRWISLTEKPEAHCWDGLESMVNHRGDLYFLTSTTEDMYGYMHHAAECKKLWKLDLHECSWTQLSTPTQLRGQSRLVSHVNGLYAIDHVGLVEEYDAASAKWLPCGSPGFVEYPRSTFYILPMPVDRYIYTLRAYSGGYAQNYAQTSYSLLQFDTVRQSWHHLSENEAGDLDLKEQERFHGYTATPATLKLKTELGFTRVQFDLDTMTWETLPVPSTTLPKFIRDVWGSAANRERVYFVGRTEEHCPLFMVYNHSDGRCKAMAPSPSYICGLLCPMVMKRDQLETLTNKISKQLQLCKGTVRA